MNMFGHKTVLVIDGSVDANGEFTVIDQVTLVLGDTAIIRSDGPALIGDEALHYRVGQLEAQLDRAHAQIGELRTLAAGCAQARSMDDVYEALCKYGGLDELLLISPERGIGLRTIRRVWNTFRRRPAGQA